LTSLQTQRQQSVLGLLQTLKGLEPLKKLFWTELNYDKANSPISRKGWGEQASSALVDDPMLFATGGKDFHVIHARLKSEKLLMGDERPVVSRLLQNHPYSLFIFSNASQDQWHFLNVKYDDDVQKRRLFRRISVTPLDRLRTASERLDKINLDDAPNVAPNTIQKLHDDAFDVEPVTKEFFQEYARIFDGVEGAVKGIRDAERKRLFVQRLFNRLMFVAFIQKKGWLTFNGSKDYLTTLWRAYQRDNAVADKNFYTDRLKPLFFFGLNSSNEVNQVGINRGGFLKTLIGDVPYLNGGLFDEDDDDKDEKIVVPDKALDVVLNDLFSRFNFTVTESTPLDIEVAVDPEMLGKIFEELVTGRHETGSYYTPKPIVSFMCRWALKEYLAIQLPSEATSAIAHFVDEHDPVGLHDAESALDALRRIKVCDPACGSGAYLLGMLHELLGLRAALFATKHLDEVSVYERKLEIIQRNLYGVDIDQFAINIARLRLWLSLSVDFDGHAPEPLPNLDYKIEAGDSLAAPNPSGDLEQGFRKKLIDEFLALKGHYLTAHGAEKIELRKSIEKLKETISGWSHGSGTLTGFDWAVEFAEVFASRGFDVVVANPPYVNALEFARSYPKEYRQALNRIFDSASGAYDLFVPFMERGINLLKPAGVLAYITPNKYLAASYATALREFLLENAELQKIVDLSSVPVFSTAAVYPVLTFLKHGRADTTYCIETLVPPTGSTSSDPREFVRASFSSEMLRLLPENIWGFLLSNDADLLVKVIREAKPLSQYGEVSATTTAAEADDFGEYLSNTKSKNSVKVVNTGTIEPFHCLWGKVPLKNNKQNFLTPHLPLDKKDINERRRTMYRSPKVIYAKLAKQCEAMFDAEGNYAGLNVNCFYQPRESCDLKYVAAFSNAKLFMFIYDQFFRALRMSGGYYQFQAPQLRVIPLRDAPTATKQAISGLIDAIMSDSDHEVSEKTLNKLNAHFYKLYELTEEEINRIEAG
jgi:type I restriction-modification system DNA methylase subunit